MQKFAGFFPFSLVWEELVYLVMIATNSVNNFFPLGPFCFFCPQRMNSCLSECLFGFYEVKQSAFVSQDDVLTWVLPPLPPPFLRE